MEHILELKNLSVSFHTARGEAQAVRGVSLSVDPGEVLAIVGESGCGKSVLCKTIMKLLPGNAFLKSGGIWLDGEEIAGYGERELRRLRGRVVSMVFQDPMGCLNPTVKVGEQVAEAARQAGFDRKAARRRAIELLGMVGFEQPEKSYRLYSHSLSGGMCQRAVIAIALAGGPKLLLADEPTTALDVTTQAQILDLLWNMKRRLDTAIILVSHDLGVVAKVADRVAVMYAGRIVEAGTTEEIFYDPRHPYTWGLLRSLPVYGQRGTPLYTIPGAPPELITPPKGDAFASRNEYALAIDYEEEPPAFQVSGTHFAATWLLDPRAPEILPPVRTARSGFAGEWE